MEQLDPMHHYPHHLGDYAKDTPGLTMLEHGAYRLLMDAYYVAEAPIAADEPYSIAKAGSPIERKAVDRVLRKFFVLDGDVYRQKRIDEEIASYQAKASTNRENGKLGGRPRTNPQETHPVSVGGDTENPEITLTSNQEPVTKGKRRSPKTALPENFGLSERVIDWAKEHGYGHLQEHLDTFRLKAAAGDYRYADWDSAFMAAIRADWAKVNDRRPGSKPLDEFAGVR